METIFLSHTGVDKPIVRQVNAELALLGAETHFDELGVLNGDIINEWIDRALDATTLFTLFWSAAAANAPWVKAEWTAAHWKFISEPHKFIVVRLDDTELPVLLASKKWIDARGDVGAVAPEILGLTGPARLLKAIQNTLESWEIRIDAYPGIGPLAGCGGCGAGLESIVIRTQTDYSRDDEYIEARCQECDWWTGGEI